MTDTDNIYNDLLALCEALKGDASRILGVSRSNNTGDAAETAAKND